VRREGRTVNSKEERKRKRQGEGQIGDGETVTV